MNNFLFKTKTQTTFYDVYTQYISPKVQELDLFMKLHSAPYNIEEVSSLLNIDIDEVLHIMEDLEIETINKNDFFKILHHSSSYIGNLILRQFENSSKNFYTPQTISFIYNIDIKAVTVAFKKLDCKIIDESKLHILFKNIILPKFTFVNF